MNTNHEAFADEMKRDVAGIPSFHKGNKKFLPPHVATGSFQETKDGHALLAIIR